MKNIRWAVCSLIAVVGLNTPIATSAAEGGTRFHVDLGVSYVNGAYDVNKQLKASVMDNGFILTSDTVIPVGLSISPRVEFANGFGGGVSVGPASLIAVQKNGGFSSSSDISYIIPVGGFVQYNFLSREKVSPYVRGGVKFPITGGDYVKDGTVGGYGAVGVQFFKQKRVGVGLEVGYDSSSVTVSAGSNDRTTRKATPTGLTASLVFFF